MPSTDGARSKGGGDDGVASSTGFVVVPASAHSSTPSPASSSWMKESCEMLSERVAAGSALDG